MKDEHRPEDLLSEGLPAAEDRCEWESPKKLHPYATGSMGPEAALEMLPAGSWPEKP